MRRIPIRFRRNPSEPDPVFALRAGKKEGNLVARGHVPVRTCLVCMRKRPKGELVRLGFDAATGAVVPDPRQRMEGRGGYACRECFQELRFNRRVQRAFRNEARELRLDDVLGKKN